MEKNLGGASREDQDRVREELQREGTSDEYISLLAEPDLGDIVMQALDRDGLDDVLQQAAIALGAISLLSVGAWGVFRRKEL